MKDKCMSQVNGQEIGGRSSETLRLETISRSSDPKFSQNITLSSYRNNMWSQEMWNTENKAENSEGNELGVFFVF